jgi:5'-nucleotidase
VVDADLTVLSLSLPLLLLCAALEISHEISEDQRAAYMLEWWHKAHDLLLEQNIFHHDIEDAVRRAREQGVLELRKGAREFLHLLQSERIPCLIFSAGVKATIEATLKQEELLLDNLSLIGNEMVFEEGTGRLLSFSEDTITSSNKNYSHVHCQAKHYHEQSCHRKNLILLGDNIGDAGMARGFENEEVVLKIGLLHDNVEARLDQFKSEFDVVLLNDADCSFAHQLVKDIIEGKKVEEGAQTEENGTKE